ncbi:YnfU family zinc-binding protein [Pantoea rwandensis]|uniref:YnfU family zinc-binding protein n=1 Tax=unclassified Pantoea TaxID=2630326 RepID=UPI001CD226AB|nr:YnfU family zinc-binding protein [Pantoea sp. alder69]MCA1253805.1 YnfU family zinc-binding protein [Pantoea sp. alder70]MCA1267371.1 YnfU family zinc-binding protein [Pantoea sp. alder81]
MSYFSQVMDRIARINTDAKCPNCGKSSKHPIAKVSREQALLCPYCKSLFVIHG